MNTSYHTFKIKMNSNIIFIEILVDFHTSNPSGKVRHSTYFDQFKVKNEVFFPRQNKIKPKIFDSR